MQFLVSFSTTWVKCVLWNQDISINVYVAWIFIKTIILKKRNTNPSLTLARTLTLSTGEQFHVQSYYNTTIFNFAYMNSPKNLGRDTESTCRSEIDFRRKSQLHEIDT